VVAPVSDPVLDRSDIHVARVVDFPVRGLGRAVHWHGCDVHGHGLGGNVHGLGSHVCGLHSGVGRRPHGGVDRLGRGLVSSCRVAASGGVGGLGGHISRLGGNVDRLGCNVDRLGGNVDRLGGHIDRLRGDIVVVVVGNIAYSIIGDADNAAANDGGGRRVFVHNDRAADHRVFTRKVQENVLLEVRRKIARSIDSDRADGSALRVLKRVRVAILVELFQRVEDFTDVSACSTRNITLFVELEVVSGGGSATGHRDLGSGGLSWKLSELNSGVSRSVDGANGVLDVLGGAWDEGNPGLGVLLGGGVPASGCGLARGQRCPRVLRVVRIHHSVAGVSVVVHVVVLIVLASLSGGEGQSRGKERLHSHDLV